MSSIIDFSDQPNFTIKSVSVQTGIRPVTLRAWERRHEILTPYRSDNRYRLYSERDVAILRWIKSRVDEGISISSAVSELRTMQKNNLWPEAIPSALVATRPLKPAQTPETYSRELYQALRLHDEARASELMREIHASFDLLTSFSRIIVPALVEIGEAWYLGEIQITTEHFASSFLRGRLLSLLQAYPVRRNAPYILVGSGPDEQHEIGSLMMAVLLRSEGFRVEYLGPDVPLEDLVDYSSFEKPSMIVLGAYSEETGRKLSRLQEKLNHLKRPPLFGYGGSAFSNNPELVKAVPGIFLGDTLESSLENVKQIFEHAN